MIPIDLSGKVALVTGAPGHFRLTLYLKTHRGKKPNDFSLFERFAGYRGENPKFT